MEYKRRLIGFNWTEMQGIEDYPVGLGLGNLPSLHDWAFLEDGMPWIVVRLRRIEQLRRGQPAHIVLTLFHR